MLEERSKLLKEWRPISWWDRVRSLFQNTPVTFGEWSEAYSDFILKVLSSEDLEVLSIDRHYIVVVVEKATYSFWIANYPYSYGWLNLKSGHKWFHSQLNWKAVLKVRELQLKHRDKFFRNYDEDQSKL